MNFLQEGIKVHFTEIFHKQGRAYSSYDHIKRLNWTMRQYCFLWYKMYLIRRLFNKICQRNKLECNYLFGRQFIFTLLFWEIIWFNLLNEPFEWHYMWSLGMTKDVFTEVTSTGAILSLFQINISCFHLAYQKHYKQDADHECKLIHSKSKHAKHSSQFPNR